MRAWPYVRLSKISWWIIGTAVAVGALFLLTLVLIEVLTLSDSNPFDAVEHMVNYWLNSLCSFFRPHSLKK